MLPAGAQLVEWATKDQKFVSSTPASAGKRWKYEILFCKISDKQRLLFHKNIIFNRTFGSKKKVTWQPKGAAHL